MDEAGYTEGCYFWFYLKQIHKVNISVKDVTADVLWEALGQL